METIINSKGQITVPPQMRQQLGIQVGTYIHIDLNTVTRQIILTPITRDYIHSLRGKYKGRGLMKSLMDKKRLGVWVFLMPVNFKTLAVELIQTVFCSKPHETHAVLRYWQYTALGKSVFHRKVIETDLTVGRGLLRLRLYCNAQGQYDCQQSKAPWRKKRPYTVHKMVKR